MQLLIDSRDRQNYDNTESTNCIINNTYIQPIKQIKLIHAIIPNTHYLFDSNNSTITFQESAGDLTATIIPGNYSTTQLTAHLKVILDAAGLLTYTVTYNDITNKLTISATGNVTLKFSENNSPWKELGFNNSDTSSSSSHISPNSIDISNIKYINIHIDGLKYNVMSTSNQYASFIIPINVQNNIENYFNINTNFCNYITTYDSYLSQFHIKLTRDNNKTLNLNGSDYQLLFEIN